MFFQLLSCFLASACLVACAMIDHGFNIHPLTISLGHMVLLLFPCFSTCFLLVTYSPTVKEPGNIDDVPATWFIICSQDFKGGYYKPVEVQSCQFLGLQFGDSLQSKCQCLCRTKEILCLYFYFYLDDKSCIFQ